MRDQLKAKAQARARETQASEPRSAKSPKDGARRSRIADSKKNNFGDALDKGDANAINHFHEIGWMNPDQPTSTFAGPHDQDNLVRKTFDDPVYNPQFYLSGDFPPPVIFLPSEQLLETMIRKVAECQDATIEELMSQFGIASLCHICDGDIENEESDRFRWEDHGGNPNPECPHADFHARCMKEAAQDQEVELD